MYSEKTFKNYIFWIQVKRVVLIILLSCIGAGLGIGIGAILKGTFQIENYNTIIIIVSTIIFFLLSLIITSGTGKEVQDGYWKIALLRKLTAIQKTLEANNEILLKDDTLKIEAMRKLNREILGETEEVQMMVANPRKVAKVKAEKPIKVKPEKVAKVEKISKIEKSVESNVEKEVKSPKKKVLKKPELIK